MPKKGIFVSTIYIYKHFIKQSSQTDIINTIIHSTIYMFGS